MMGSTITAQHLEAWCVRVAGDNSQRQQQCTSGHDLPVSCKELQGLPSGVSDKRVVTGS